jgi:hypothetical protein
MISLAKGELGISKLLAFSKKSSKDGLKFTLKKYGIILEFYKRVMSEYINLCFLLNKWNSISEIKFKYVKKCTVRNVSL